MRRQLQTLEQHVISLQSILKQFVEGEDFDVGVIVLIESKVAHLVRCFRHTAVFRAERMISPRARSPRLVPFAQFPIFFVLNLTETGARQTYSSLMKPAYRGSELSENSYTQSGLSFTGTLQTVWVAS